MAKKVNYDEVYSQLFENKFNGLLKGLEKIFRNKNPHSKEDKLMAYREPLVKEFSQIFKEKKNDSFKIDHFVEKVIFDFGYRTRNYDRDPVTSFLTYSLPLIREDYKDRKEQIIYMELYTAKDIDMVTFLAEYYGLKKFLDNSERLYPQKTDSVEEVLEKIKEGGWSASGEVGFDDLHGYSEVEKSNLKWTDKANKNEFVQLMYALHQAKLINNGEGQITKIVEEVARYFNLDLGKFWQQTHSATLHKRNSDYKPTIFKQLEEAYTDYSTTLIQKKRRIK